MPKPPQLTPFSREWQLYSELPSDDKVPLPISKAEPNPWPGGSTPYFFSWEPMDGDMGSSFSWIGIHTFGIERDILDSPCLYSWPLFDLRLLWQTSWQVRLGRLVVGGGVTFNSPVLHLVVTAVLRQTIIPVTVNTEYSSSCTYLALFILQSAALSKYWSNCWTTSPPHLPLTCLSTLCQFCTHPLSPSCTRLFPQGPDNHLGKVGKTYCLSTYNCFWLIGTVLNCLSLLTDPVPWIQGSLSTQL